VILFKKKDNYILVDKDVQGSDIFKKGKTVDNFRKIRRITNSSLIVDGTTNNETDAKKEKAYIIRNDTNK